MKTSLALFSAVSLAILSMPAHAQAPPGSYQQTCREIRMEGPILSAVCMREHGRGDQLTALNVARCVGDIRNLNGQLQCTGGRPVPPPARGPNEYPGAAYPPPPGYGYGAPPRYGEEQAYQERCEHLWHEQREIRDRLAYTPYGEEREHLEYRLGQVNAERERCPHR
jgi:CVNH domain